MRTVIWVQPVEKSVPLHGPNPDSCARDLDAEFQLVRNPQTGVMSEFNEGDTFGSVFGRLTANCGVRFQYARNPPATNPNEKVGATYRMTAFGLSSPEYDVRYTAGILRVVAA